MLTYASQFIERAVEHMAKFPGIGKKTALRMVLYLLKQDPDYARELSQAIIALKKGVRYCGLCHALADEDMCHICSSADRDHSLLCVVADVYDVLAIENTASYEGVYHVIGGTINPMRGIHPEQLNIASLLNRVNGKMTQPVKEVILALGATLDGDTTTHYLMKKLLGSLVKISTLARGIPVGGELEYTDEITLKRSLQERVQYAHALKQVAE